MASQARCRFQRDVVWNLVAFGVAGVSGILLSLLISVYYDAAALGTFNQVFAVYILFSQLSVLGVHQSTLKYVAEQPTADRRKAIVWAALAVVAVLSAILAGLFYALGPFTASMLDSRDLAVGMQLAAPGLALFGLNKVTLATLNGLRFMRAFALFTAGRFVLMLATFLVLVSMGAAASSLPLLLTVAELGTFVGTVLVVLPALGRSPAGRLGVWIRKHIEFGIKGFMSGVLVELNTRVDVLMLGYFAGDALVGVYSFAAITAEGFFQGLVVFRNNYNPLLAAQLAKRQFTELREMIRRGRNTVWLIACAGGIVAVAGYHLLVPRVTNDPGIAQSSLIFAILVTGIVASAGYVPFSQLLIQAGQPGWHTIMMLAAVSFNVAANGLLIPRYGAEGAALATALSFVMLVPLLLTMVRWRIGKIL